jgi:hypothetical protein
MIERPTLPQRLRHTATTVEGDGHVTAARLMREAADDLEDLQSTFDMQWRADRRATRMWQAETGRNLEWPDGAKLSVWLLHKLDENGVVLPERAQGANVQEIPR